MVIRKMEDKKAKRMQKISERALERLASLNVAEYSPAVEESYDRHEFGHGWDDMDSDGQNERAEILIRFCRPKKALEFATTHEKRVVSGKWRCRFTGESFTQAAQVDIDHVVPLKNAWLSGANLWSRERREQYANGFGIKSKKRSWLLPVSASANRAKGAKGPEEWLPPRVEYHVKYAAQWILHKSYWSMSVTSAEKASLESILTGKYVAPSPVSMTSSVSRIDRIIASLVTYSGRRTSSSKPYVVDLRKHAGIPDITTAERDEAYNAYKSKS